MAISVSFIKIIPKVVFLPFVFLFCITNQAQSLDTRVRRVVIDPGHGGKDPGAVGKIHYEKDIVLSVSLRFGRLIEEWFPDVEVIYTRNRDYYVELADRSDIANKAHADLFISVHANANDSREAVGSETYVMGLHMSKDNLDVAMRENSVITYEDDYHSKYEGFDPRSPESYIMFLLMQNAYLDQSIKLAELFQNEFSQGPIMRNRGVRQAGFLVLWRTAAPSVLVELGFMSNIKEEETLGDPEMQDQLAERMLIAFKKYKEIMDARAVILNDADSGQLVNNAEH